MTTRTRSLHVLLRRTALATFAYLLAAHPVAQAQTRWVVDGKGSLAWWQVDPHMNHLWATTCPSEPTWKVGEGHSSGWTNHGAVTAEGTRGFANVSDTIHVPLYPRPRIRTLCEPAVKGYVVLPDTVGWRGAHGEIIVDATKIFTGERERDEYAQNAILGVHVYPDIKYKIDSLVNMSYRGDTLVGTAMGQWTFRGKTRPVNASVESYRVSSGTRVLAKFRIPVMDLIKEYGVSRRSVGLGIGLNIWKTLFVGVDLLMRTETAPAGTD
jgi:polyisoprenoid-binding protein YceI